MNYNYDKDAKTKIIINENMNAILTSLTSNLALLFFENQKGERIPLSHSPKLHYSNDYSRSCAVAKINEAFIMCSFEDYVLKTDDDLEICSFQKQPVQIIKTSFPITK